jgi:hypothetical protein
LAQIAGSGDALVARVNARELPVEIGLQAAALRECLAEETARHLAARLLGVDRLSGVTQMGLGVGGLFVSGLAAAVGFLVTGVAVGALGRAWDDSPAGLDGAVARAARAVAAMSARAPAVVIIDGADCLDHDLAVTLVENLVARSSGHILAVVAVNLDSKLKSALLERSRMGITEGLVHLADTDPDMGFEARLALVRELLPGLPGAAARRVARGTATFSEVFAVSSSPGLADVSPSQDEAPILVVVDALLAARLPVPIPSPEAVVIAWAGGLLSARQAGLALDVLHEQRADSADPDVLRWESLERLESPASPRLTLQVAALGVAQRQAMAAELLKEALAAVCDMERSLVERVAAAQAVHRVRSDLANQSRLPRLQRELIAGLEAIGDPGSAFEVVAAALDEWAGGCTDDRDWLAAAALRLSPLTPERFLPPEAAQLVDEAVASGSASGLEARIWAAASLLTDSSQREAALTLVDQASADLDRYADALAGAGTRWRLLLAFHAGRSGYPAAAEQTLAPMLNCGDPGKEDPARAVLHAVRGPGADTRLQNVLLEQELAALTPSADDERIRIRHVLAANHSALGEYHQALTNGRHELSLRKRIYSPEHPETLAIRGQIAVWTAECGDQELALRLAKAVLVDEQRVLGPRHLGTLGTRNNIAAWTGYTGEPAKALNLFKALHRDEKLLLGPRHRQTLRTRNNVAYWTGQCGDRKRALDLFKALLFDLETALGPDHPDTLATRDNIANGTGERGNPSGALSLLKALLPDKERVLGPHHPDTLITRSHIAYWTTECGDQAEALQLYLSLLADESRVLGPRHPSTRTTRNNVKLLTHTEDDLTASDPSGQWK